MKKNATLKAGRPSTNNRATTLASLADNITMKRVNFELSPYQHTKLKIYAAKTGRSIRELFTEYVDNLPDEK